MHSTCVSCGSEVDAAARFCPACGSALWQTCPVCGHEERAAATFCSSCGSALRADAQRAADVVEHEERRVVTVLFADLAGSTAFGESVDPEDVRAVQAELYELVNDQVESHGGTTEKFAGDAVLAVFGAPQVHEDDADRAVRAALAIRDAFPALAAGISKRHGVEIGLRVGVNTGEVIAGREASARGELMVSGDAVNVAARLQQLAEPGTVLAGERTYQATQRTIEYAGARELVAKGKSTSLRAYVARQARSAAPGRVRQFAAPLVGRDEELELLRLTASRVARERAPQLVTVFGNAGVGKSRLLEEFRATLERARVVTGRCVPYGDGITYLPLAEVARQLVGVHEDEPAEVALQRVREAVEAVVPPEQMESALSALSWTMGLELPGGSTGMAVLGDARPRMHEGWAAYLAALGREQLLVLVLDDIHWASEPLLDLLDDLAARLEDTAVLVLCPSRPELLDTRPGWGTGRMHASSLTLSPLASGEAQGLLRALLGADDVSDDVARAILEPAEGNPFFVEEMLSMLVEHGALARKNGGWTTTAALATLSVPDSIHGVIAARIDLLQAREREALRRCSVMGRVFWPSAVGIEDDVIAALGKRALVSEQPESSYSGRREFAFKHALTHDVAYGTLPRRERRELHRRVADWLSEVVRDRQAETSELIAYHYEQALAHGEGDPELEERTFSALLAATDASVRRGSYSTAASLIARALEIAPSEEQRARALLLAAQVDVHTADYERAAARLEEVLVLAQRWEDRALRADALGWKARASWLRGNWQDALESAEGAVAALEGEASSPELARALARLSQIQMLRALSSTEATAVRAIAVAQESGELTAEANARINLLTDRSRHTAPSTEELAEIVELATRDGAHDEAVRAVVNYLWSAWVFSPLDVVEATVVEAARDLQRGLAAEAYAEYLRLSLAALVYVPAARWEEADEVVRSEEALLNVSNRLVWWWLAAGLALRRGELDRVDRLLPEFRETALASEEPQRILPMVSVAMPRALLAGDVEDVRRLGELVLGLHELGPIPEAPAISRALAASGERDLLERLVRALRRRPQGVRKAFGDLAHGLFARLDGDAARGAALLREAENALLLFGREYEGACAALELARALKEIGDDAGAAGAQGRANELFERLGCVNPW